MLASKLEELAEEELAEEELAVEELAGAYKKLLTAHATRNGTPYR